MGFLGKNGSKAEKLTTTANKQTKQRQSLRCMTTINILHAHVEHNLTQCVDIFNETS